MTLFGFFSNLVYEDAADFIRFQLLAQNNTFTFETVLSHPSKLSFLQQARTLGYKNYLYFVCTVDPAINISRVAQRVALKGHDVPETKIVNRYYDSLALLPSLIPPNILPFESIHFFLTSRGFLEMIFHLGSLPLLGKLQCGNPVTKRFVIPLKPGKSLRRIGDGSGWR